MSSGELTLGRVELVRQEPMPVAVSAAPSVEAMLRAVVDKGVTGENVAALEKLVGLYERLQDKDAERQFNSAFVALQNDLPQIVAQSIIPNRGKYEKFEDVMTVVAPLLRKHGFSVSFTNDSSDGRVIETCHVRHIGGHSQSNSFKVRVGRADTETQADCKAATTAKRNALLNAFNIVVRQDCLNSEDDARIEGGNITAKQAEELEHRVHMTNSNVADFLKYAGAKSFKEITTGAYDDCDQMLRRKEQRGR